MQLHIPKNHFTVGIDDDVTFRSLPVGEQLDVSAKGTVNCKFWGLGSDGTVGANKNSIKIIGDHTDMYVQAYFEYDTKKSGGITRSHLRFGKQPIIGSYLITKADFVACHNQSYLDKYDIVQEIKQSGTFLLNTIWKPEELSEKLPAATKRYIANNKVKFYVINAVKIGKELGLGNRTNSVLQAAFFKLSHIIPQEDAVHYMKDAIKNTYGNKGEKIVNMNYAAVDAGISQVVEIQVPEEWKEVQDKPVVIEKNIPDFVKKVAMPINSLKGDLLPVSAFKGHEDGSVPLGTTKYEKRGVAVDVPEWNGTNCLQCNQCALACSHAAIRPFLLTEEEAGKAPEGMYTVQAKGTAALSKYKYRMQIDPLDCLGCGVCINVCPAKDKALQLRPLATQLKESANWEYALQLSAKENPLDKYSVKGSQFEQPLLEFSGACAGCGETPYMKLLTQLYGDRLIVANATGCTQAWGGAMPSFPYTKNKNGHGPAWSNSLFENNAEYALGMCLSTNQQRQKIASVVKELIAGTNDKTLNTAATQWLADYNDGDKTTYDTNNLLEALKSAKLSEQGTAQKNIILENADQLRKKSIWMYGGDGWAYDIGYGGLDHVLASGADINVLLVDTEVYSNTGGQSSKSTPLAAVAQFAFSGKKTMKKDLGLLAMSYGYVYVASVAMGANPGQLIKAMKEAESYHGPSLIICYAPCINHGLVKGMGCAQEEMKVAVQTGYWKLYRYNPVLKEMGKNPLQLDSQEPTVALSEFFKREVRFASLGRTFPAIAQRLQAQAVKETKEKFEEYKMLAEKK